MKENKHYIELKEGKINKVTIAKEAVAHIDIERDSVLYINTKSTSEKDPVDKQIWLSKLISNYKGPSIYFDFNDRQELIGIEILSD